MIPCSQVIKTSLVMCALVKQEWLFCQMWQGEQSPTRRTQRQIGRSDDVCYYRWDYASHLPSSTHWMSSVKLGVSALHIELNPQSHLTMPGHRADASLGVFSCIPPDVYPTPRYTFIHDLCPPDFPLASKCPQPTRQLALPPIPLPQYLTLPQSSIKP